MRNHLSITNVIQYYKLKMSLNICEIPRFKQIIYCVLKIIQILFMFIPQKVFNSCSGSFEEAGRI